MSCYLLTSAPVRKGDVIRILQGAPISNVDQQEIGS
jgi:hypothetical protein